MEDDVPVEDLMKLKLIVVGNQGTGKSCILNRFVNETFEENYQATIGLDFQSKNITIHDQDVRLIIYDTAGQEKFRSLIPMYIREAQIILLIYDISDKYSFDSMPKWIQEVNDILKKDVVFALVGNKIDLEQERKVTFEEGKKLADQHNFIFQEVSAKNGSNFEKLFDVQIYEAVYNKFRKEFEKREGGEEQPNFETNDYTNEYNENQNKQVKLDANNINNNAQSTKKKKRCC
jgi:Ras-related protein Rab-6A